MNDARIKQTEWVLTEGAFNGFLSRLDPDAERAGEKYEAIRRRLVKHFDWRGAHFPEECADETINRIIRKLESGETILDIPTYCLGIARFVFLETLKRSGNRPVSLDNLNQVAATPSSEEESIQRECFERCLNELSEENRQLVLRYYEDERRGKIDNRQAMADRLGIPLNALRSRVQRIRDKLERCVMNCSGKLLSTEGKK